MEKGRSWQVLIGTWKISVLHICWLWHPKTFFVQTLRSLNIPNWQRCPLKDSWRLLGQPGAEVIVLVSASQGIPVQIFSACIFHRRRHQNKCRFERRGTGIRSFYRYWQPAIEPARLPPIFWGESMGCGTWRFSRTLWWPGFHEHHEHLGAETRAYLSASVASVLGSSTLVPMDRMFHSGIQTTIHFTKRWDLIERLERIQRKTSKKSNIWCIIMQ